MDIGVSAASLRVSRLRQIHHLPLIWQGRAAFDLVAAAKALGENWRASSQGGDADDPDSFSYEEFVYFHDFLREFLYPQTRQKIRNFSHGAAGRPR